MSLLEVKNVKKIYTTRFGSNQVEALRDVNFTVERGEYVAIMGESGSGKTTLLNILAALDKTTEGKVYLKDRDLGKLKEKEIATFRRQNLGFVFQDFNLLDTHTMYENISMPLALAHVSKAEIEKRVKHLADELQITSLLHKYPNECSGGQRQRGAICRALINNPHIIVADEPTGNLDSVNSSELLQLLQKMNRENGVTIVMVTHDPLIASFTTRLVYIKDGNIETVLDKGDMNQDEYFNQIVELNSRESREILAK